MKNIKLWILLPNGDMYIIDSPLNNACNNLEYKDYDHEDLQGFLDELFNIGVKYGQLNKLYIKTIN